MKYNIDKFIYLIMLLAFMWMGFILGKRYEFDRWVNKTKPIYDLIFWSNWYGKDSINSIVSWNAIHDTGSLKRGDIPYPDKMK